MLWSLLSTVQYCWNSLMKKQETKLLISLYAYFATALIIAVGEDNVYYRCKGVERSAFSCDAGRVIIVQSAIVGAADKKSLQCPVTNNTCMNEITNAAELCTGRNSCDIMQNILQNDEWKLSCPRNGKTEGNFMNVSYTCIFPDNSNYGDICHFDGDLYNNSAVYISSYPKLPDAMGNDSYRCSCLLTSKYSSSSAIVTIRALLVKLTGSSILGIFALCPERLSVISSGGETKLEFCSPCSNANDVTTVPLASVPVEILFRRDANVSPFNGKFILEITVSSMASEIGSMGSIKCGLVGSTMFSSTTVTTTIPSYSSTTTTTTTSAMLNQSNRFSSTNVQITSSEITTKSHNRSIAPPTDEADLPALAGRSASEKTSLSTGGIIGIVLGSVGLIVIVIIVLLCLLRKRKQNRDQSKVNTNFTVQESLTVTQNMQTTNNIELHEATSSELHTFQSAAHFSDEPQTTGYENNWQAKDNSMSNYEEGAAVSGATYGPGMIQANEKTRLRGDDLTTETQLLNSCDGDITLVENQLYGENEKPMTDVVASSDYAVVRPVVQDGRTDESAEVDRVYAVVQMKNSSADHSYYNVPGHTGSGTVHSPTEVSAEAETNSASDEIETTNPMYKADSDVVLIDNTLYGSMLTF